MIKFFSKSPLSIKLAALLVLCFVLQNFIPPLTGWFAFSNPSLQAGHWWTLLTYSLMHGGALHLMMNLFALTFMLPVENIIGWKRTLAYYTLGCLAGSLIHIGAGQETLVGASAGISTIAALFVLYLPNQKILFMFIPVQAKWGGIAFLAYSAFGLFSHSQVAHDSHLAGALVGIAAWFAIPKRFVTINKADFEPAPPKEKVETEQRSNPLFEFCNPLFSYLWVAIALPTEIMQWWLGHGHQVTVTMRLIGGLYLTLTLLLALLPTIVTWPARMLLIQMLLEISFPNLGIAMYDFQITVLILGWGIGLLVINWLRKGNHAT